MTFRAVVILTILISLTACSKLNLDNYKMLKAGMSYEEVTDIIGAPESCSENFASRSCIWGDDEGMNIKASFVSDNAISFSHDKLK